MRKLSPHASSSESFLLGAAGLSMRRQSKSGSKSRRNDRRRSSTAVVPVSSGAGLVDETSSDPFQLSTCCVCGGVEDEDLIILCDGHGCNSEAHMYCLTPVMTAVPDGDWFCDCCDGNGTTKKLKKYFADFEATEKLFRPKGKENYNDFLITLQERAVPLDQWVPSTIQELVQPQFDPAAEDLIGCIVRLSISPSETQSGRIMNRRYDEEFDRWEHLVQFKR